MSLSITNGPANVALRQLTIPQVKDAPPSERLTSERAVERPVEEPREVLPPTVTSSINPLTIKTAAPERSAEPLGRPAIEPAVSFDRDTGIYSAAVKPADTTEEPLASQGSSSLGNNGLESYKRTAQLVTDSLAHIRGIYS